MEVNQTPEAPAQLPKPGEIINNTQSAQQTTATPQPSQPSAPEKSNVNSSLLTLLSITFCLGLCFMGLLIGDIRAGLLRGEPETGWGLAIAIFLIGPPLILFGIIALIRIIGLKRSGHKIGPTIKKAGVIAVILLIISVLYSVGMNIYEQYTGV